MTAPSDRKAAVAAEIARRESALSVPPALQAYVLQPHHGDEGGPRTFYPTRELTQRERQVNPNPLYSRLLEDLVRQAIETGTPIEVAPDSGPTRARRPLADWSLVGAADLMIFTRAAFDALASLIVAHGEIIPVSCPGFDLVGFRPTAVADVLDKEKTVARWGIGKLQGTANSIHRYAFDNHRLAHAPSIFRIPQYHDFIVLQAVPDMACMHRLKGIRFCKVWPSAGGNLWNKVKENWITPGQTHRAKGIRRRATRSVNQRSPRTQS